MTDTLFERYKEALRAGHVSVVRGRLERAVLDYREAISIAPDRPIPRAALGSVHLRLGDPEAALEAYDAALAIAPDDEAATQGRAQALVVLRRTADAAATYDRLADTGAGVDQPVVAAEAARRALAIEPTDDRRARHAALVERLRATDGAAVADGAALDAVHMDEAGLAAAEEIAAGAAAPPAPDPEAFVVAAEEATARGDADAAAAASLAAARAYRVQGHVDAAFDACLQGIAARPADVDLYLLLADLAVGRGWTEHGGATYRNLLRLVELDDDAVRVAVIRTAAAEHLPGDPRFGPG